MLQRVMEDLDRKDLKWIAIGGLLAGVFSFVAYDQLFNLHFSAWRLYDTHPSTEPLAKAVRGPVTGWYRPFTVVAAGLAGLAGVVRALAGSWKPLAVLVGLTVLLIVLIESTQSAGQETTPTSEVDVVATISVIWTALLGLVPLAVVAVSVLGILRRNT